MERRKDGHRRRVLKTGLITVDGHFTSMECLVRDISPNGARIQVENLLGVPSEFDLFVINDDFMRPAQVRWRHGNQIGLEFVEKPAEEESARKLPKLRAKRTDKPFPPVPENASA